MGVLLGVMIPVATLQITPEILGLIAELDEFKGAWRAMATLSPDRLSALRRVATIEWLRVLPNAGRFEHE